MPPPARTPVSRVPREGLRRFFAGLVRPSFGALGLGSGELAEYATDLLTRFARTDELYRLRNARGERLETVAEMLIELMRAWDSETTYSHTREVEIRRHCGDYALFMSGVFRPHVEGESLLGYYLSEGESAYRIVGEHLQMTYAQGAALYRALAAEFERLSGALDYMRKVYMRPEMHDGAYAELVRQFGTN